MATSFQHAPPAWANAAPPTQPPYQNVAPGPQYAPVPPPMQQAPAYTQYPSGLDVKKEPVGAYPPGLYYGDVAPPTTAMGKIRFKIAQMSLIKKILVFGSVAAVILIAIIVGAVVGKKEARPYCSVGTVCHTGWTPNDGCPTDTAGIWSCRFGATSWGDHANLWGCCRDLSDP